MMEEKNLERAQEPTSSERPPFSGRTTKLLGLFAATALAVSVGCSDTPTSSPAPTTSSNVAVGPDGQPIDDSDYCMDENDDGYCDNDGARIDTNTFIWIGGIDIDVDHKKKKYYKSGKPDSSHTYSYGSGSSSSNSGVSNGTSGSTSSSTSKPPSNTSQPPTSAKGTGQVINKSSSGTGSNSSSSTNSTSGSSSSSGSGSNSSVSSSGNSSSSSSSSSGVSSSSGKGGIGSSSSSSSS